MSAALGRLATLLGLGLLAAGVAVPDLSDPTILALLAAGAALVSIAATARLRAASDPRRRRVVRVGATLFALQLAALARGLRLAVVHPEATAGRRAVADDDSVLSNVRVAADSLTLPRGRVVTADGTVVARSKRRGEIYAREYPEPSAHSLVGYASPLKFGLSGLEAALDDRLVGEASMSLSAAVRSLLLGRQAATATAHLSIDVALQRRAVELLDGLVGSAVLLETDTGRVLAMASTPTVDPNALVAVDADTAERAQAAWEAIVDDPRRPLLSRATTGLYPPGSTFKVVTAATAVERGVAAPDTVYADDGELTVDGRTLVERNRPDPTRSTWTVAEGLAWSLNLVYAQIGLDLGADALGDGASAFGVGEAIPFLLPTATGQVASSPDGLDADTALADTAFGQGELLVTPLHMALVAAAVARDGTVPVPTLLDRVTADGDVVERTEPRVWRRAVSAETAAAVDRMMVDSATYGYARTAAVDGLRVGAKTGTAESGQEAPHSWFIGYAEGGARPVTVAVCVEFGGEGGGLALTVGRELLAAASFPT